MDEIDMDEIEAALQEVIELQEEESIYVKLDPGKSQKFTFLKWERLDKTVDWDGEEQVVDTSRVYLEDENGIERFFDRNFNHSFTQEVLGMIKRGDLKPGQPVRLKKGKGKYGQYQLLPLPFEE